MRPLSAGGARSTLVGQLHLRTKAYTRTLEFFSADTMFLLRLPDGAAGAPGRQAGVSMNTELLQWRIR